ncbi:MAG: hypothetical protein KJ061_18785 [Vicinamibacteraceae bacterium]|nr:hypothetical protein [Vicinamibacteraceae bacterium]
MRFTIDAPGAGLNREERAHLEYRVFMALAPLGGRVRHVHIALGAEARTRRPVCAITVLRHEGWLTARASGGRLYEAVDRAAARVAARAGQEAVA